MAEKVNVMPEREVRTLIDAVVSGSGTSNTLTSSITATNSYSKVVWLFDINAKTGGGATPDSYTAMLAFGDSNATANMYDLITLTSRAFVDTAVTFATTTSILANWTRIEIVTEGTSATAKYTMTVKAILSNGI